MSALCIYRFFSPQPLDTRCIPTFARPLPSSLLFPLICVCLCSKVILISYCNGSGRFGISLFPKLVLVFCFCFFFNYFLTVLQSMWDLCSLIGDWTCALCIEKVESYLEHQASPCPGDFWFFLLFCKLYDQNKFCEQSCQGFCWKLPQICVLWRTAISKILKPSFHDYGGSLHSSGLPVKPGVFLSYFVVLNNVLLIFSIKV